MFSLFFLPLLFIGSTALDGSKFNAKLADQSTDTVAQFFIASLNAALRSQDRNQISQQFSDDFSFRGCKGVYNKAKAVDALTSAWMTGKFAMQLKSVRDTSRAIVVAVHLLGFGDPIDAEFSLQRQFGRPVLTRGSIVTNCPKPVQTSQINDDVTAQSFLNSLQLAISSGDRKQFDKYISEEFVFHGCNKKYKKKEAIAQLLSAAEVEYLTIKFKSAKKTNEKIVEFIVSLGVRRPQVDAKFTIFKHGQEFLLIGGSVLSCPKYSR